MRFQAYTLGLFLATLGPTALTVLPGCGSNGNLGGGLQDAAPPLGGAGGSTSVPTTTGGTLASGGAEQGGNSIAGGAVQGGTVLTGGAVQGGTVQGGSVLAGGAVQGGTVQGGTVVTGGAVLGGTVLTGGTVQGGSVLTGGVVQGGTVVTGGAVLAGSSAAGGSPKGGSSGTGGSSQTGDAGVGGVTLIASVTSDGQLGVLWQNQGQVSIFLYGCGTANAWKKNGSDWVNRGAGAECVWEGISPEVRPGATFPESGLAYGIPALTIGGPGTYRLQGKYGVGCTNPELGQSKAGCTAFYDAISNEVTLTAVPDAGSGGTGGTGGATGSGGKGGATASGGTTGTGGTSPGGNSGTGGSSQPGDAGIGGVTLIASVTSDGSIVPVWQNQSQVSIFLYGCGTANVWKKNGSDWVNRGTVVVCAWEGVSPEVPAGATLADSGPGYAVLAVWGPGTYRLQGRYGVGCTNPELGQSKAGCTAFYDAISNEVTLTAVPDAGGSGG
jgi:hypothetical protein